MLGRWLQEPGGAQPQRDYSRQRCSTAPRSREQHLPSLLPAGPGQVQVTASRSEDRPGSRLGLRIQMSGVGNKAVWNLSSLEVHVQVSWCRGWALGLLKSYMCGNSGALGPLGLKEVKI